MSTLATLNLRKTAIEAQIAGVDSQLATQTSILTTNAAAQKATFQDELDTVNAEIAAATPAPAPTPAPSPAPAPAPTPA